MDTDNHAYQYRPLSSIQEWHHDDILGQDNMHLLSVPLIAI